ncbi:MAG TPA: addiction module protein [Pyrinomonadaceae bacterium]|nr:addiction module protein [Pyrinomonadaceae bacterium]
MSTYEEIENAALALPPDAREMLAEHLMASLNSEYTEIDPLWLEEIERRSKEMDDGTVTPIPGEEVMARLRSRMKRK